MKGLIILPAFNEATVISKVLFEIKKELNKLPVKFEICVINDGSSDNTVNQCLKHHVTVFSHVINCGLGASLTTGLEYAQKIQADFAITLDSDGQHDPKDIQKVLSPLFNRQADVVIGSRLLNKTQKMPLIRLINNQLFNFFTLILFGVFTTDSLSGFRGFNQKAINAIKLKTVRMEASNEFFHEVKLNHLRLAEVPIKIIYTKYSIAKGVKPLTAFAILFRLLIRLLR